MTMPNVRNWSLPRRIVALGLANLVLLALVLLVFARIQYGVGPESLVAGAARDHILGIANAFRLELDSVVDKSALIASYARRYDADVYLVNPGGRTIYGPEIGLPDEVLRRMRQGPRGAPPLPPPPPPPGDDEPPPEGRPPGREPPRERLGPGVELEVDR